MRASGSAFAADDYVVRYGLRGFLCMLAGVLVWTGFACMVAAYATAPSIPAAIVLAVGEIGLLAECGVELWRTARREVVFAVHPHGVYFGSGQLGDDVPWGLIGAVELFTERAQSRGIRSTQRCVGVRAADARQMRDRRGRPSAQAARGRNAGAILAADRTSRAARASTGPRLAYRRMSGWRVDRDKLTDAVRRYAPDVPVTDGQGPPPAPPDGS